VALASEDCKPLSEPGDVADEHTIWIGTMFPLTGQAGAAFGRAHTNAANLARRDFAEVAHGLVTRSGASRRLGIVACDDGADPERAARHLVDDLHVPAVIGFYKSQEVVDLARALFVPRGVLVIAVNNRGPLVTTVPVPPGSPRLVWRATPSAAQLAAPIARIVEDVFGSELRREHALGEGDPVRVAVVRGATATSLSFGDAIAVDRARLAGAAFDDTFRQFVVSDDAPDVAGTVKAVVAYRPQVVVDEFDTMGTADVLEGIERAWPVASKRPRYAVLDLTSEGLVRFVSAFPELRHRILSVESPTSPAAVRFALRYNEVYGSNDASRSILSPAYEALYLVAYAASAADEPIDGAALARALPLLGGPGPRVEIGASGVFGVMNALRAGERVRLIGVEGPLAFDVATGDRVLDFAVTCYHVTPERSFFVESGMFYRADGPRLEGTLRCP
jgi:branched-chain amino acid transport system substrate-binding protein